MALRVAGAGAGSGAGLPDDRHGALRQTRANARSHGQVLDRSVLWSDPEKLMRRLAPRHAAASAAPATSVDNPDNSASLAAAGSSERWEAGVAVAVAVSSPAAVAASGAGADEVTSPRRWRGGAHASSEDEGMAVDVVLSPASEERKALAAAAEGPVENGHAEWEVRASEPADAGAGLAATQLSAGAAVQEQENGRSSNVMVTSDEPAVPPDVNDKLHGRDAGSRDAAGKCDRLPSVQLLATRATAEEAAVQAPATDAQPDSAQAVQAAAMRLAAATGDVVLEALEALHASLAKFVDAHASCRDRLWVLQQMVLHAEEQMAQGCRPSEPPL